MTISHHLGLCALLTLALSACQSRGPLDGLSDREMRAAKAHAQNICLAANKADPPLPEMMASMSDLAVGLDQGRATQIVEAGTALARQRGCVAK